MAGGGGEPRLFAITTGGHVATALLAAGAAPTALRHTALRISRPVTYHTCAVDDRPAHGIGVLTGRVLHSLVFEFTSR